MFCKQCKTIWAAVRSIHTINVPVYKFYPWESPDATARNEIATAAAQGCEICRRLWKRWENESFTNVEVRILVEDLQKTPERLLIEIRVMSGDIGRGGIKLEFRRVKRSEDRLKIPGYKIGPNTSSAACLEALSEYWTSTCDKNHDRCKISRTNWNPSRLISIEDNGNTLRLVEGDQIPPNTRYTTLSHCWGIIPDKMVLTDTRLEDWKKKIPPLGNLKTFADAIDITYRLGVKYIWIDSFCIIQNSLEDWRHESTHMSKVYKNSFCSIGALSAEDDTGGCYFERDTAIDLPLRMNWRIESLPSRMARILQCWKPPSGNRLASLLPNGTYDLLWGGEEEWALGKRAWVTQETVLAPRILQFSNQEIRWECNGMACSESSPFGNPPTFWGNSNNKYFAARVLEQAGQLSGSESNSSDSDEDFDEIFRDAMFSWERAVKMFSQGDLTRQEDKLVAISAIARTVHSAINTKYLAGHWDYELLGQLTWYTYKQDDGRKKYRPQPYRCPSWAWPSTNGEAWYVTRRHRTLGEGFVELASIKEVVVEYETDDQFGQVKSGHLTLETNVLKFEYIETNTALENGRAIVQLEGRGTNADLYEDDLDAPIDSGVPLACIIFTAVVQPKESTRSDSGEKDTQTFPDGSMVAMQAVLAEPVEGENVYRRVGLLRKEMTLDYRCQGDTFFYHGMSMNRLKNGDWKLEPKLDTRRTVKII